MVLIFMLLNLHGLHKVTLFLICWSLSNAEVIGN